MNITLRPAGLCGTVKAPPSKSQAHRLLICAALSKRPCRIVCGGLSQDIEATMRCLRAIGAEIEEKDGIITVIPAVLPPSGTVLADCGESGSTLRFLLPVMGALGLEGEFIMRGRLPQRPLAPLDGELVAHGMRLERREDRLCFSGRLATGRYTLPGDVSSQYISGLLFALPLLDGDSELSVTGPIESAPYIAMTERALDSAGIAAEKCAGGYIIPGGQAYRPAEHTAVEGDWSNAAFWLCAGAIQRGSLSVIGLDPSSPQGDRGILSMLCRFGADIELRDGAYVIKGKELRGIAVDAAQIPDLVPALSVVGAAAKGVTRIYNAARLRIKESDRLSAVHDMLSALGAELEEGADSLTIHGGRPLRGGTVSARGDHRIAMSAAIAALLCEGSVTIEGSEAVKKSYPEFWNEFKEAEE